MYGKEHDAVFKIDVHQGERFLAKIALGLGSLILNSRRILKSASKWACAEVDLSEETAD